MDSDSKVMVPELLTVNAFSNKTACIFAVGIDREDANIIQTTSATNGMKPSFAQAFIGPKLKAMLSECCPCFIKDGEPVHLFSCREGFARCGIVAQLTQLRAENDELETEVTGLMEDIGALTLRAGKTEEQRDEAVGLQQNMWLMYLDQKHALCGLCGNTGIINTLGSAISPAGIMCGVSKPCICPNGQARLRAASQEQPQTPREGGESDAVSSDHESREA